MTARFRIDPAPTSEQNGLANLLPAQPEGNRRQWMGEASERPLRLVAEAFEPFDNEAIFIPEGYEENYAYPLIVWVAGPDAGEIELHRIMSQVSTRNYMGVLFRGTDEELAAIRVPKADHDELLQACEQRLFQTVRRVRRMFHIHTERVFVAGFDQAGSLALQLGLQRPEWFAGMAAFAGRLPETPQLLARFDELRGKRVFLGAGQRDRDMPVTEVTRASRLLQSAGLRVCTRTYDADHEITRSMLTELDRWVMREIYQPAVAG